MRIARNYRSIFPLTAAEIRGIMLRIEDAPHECWRWTGTIRPQGYGSVHLRGSSWQAHIMVYELFAGPVPEGKILHHTCHNKWCCNPAHVKPATSSENNADSRANRDPNKPRRKRTHCRRGHEFTEGSFRWYTRGHYRVRICLACEAAARRRKNERRRARRAAARAAQASAGDVSDV